MDRFCPRADCKGGVGGAEDVAADAAGGPAEEDAAEGFDNRFDFAPGSFAGAFASSFAIAFGICLGAGPAEEDAAEDAAEEVCNGKRDCTDCSDRWDPCDWWGFLAAACAVRFIRSAMSRTTWSGMLRKKDMSAFQDSSS